MAPTDISRDAECVLALVMDKERQVRHCELPPAERGRPAPGEVVIAIAPRHNSLPRNPKVAPPRYILLDITQPLAKVCPP